VPRKFTMTAATAMATSKTQNGHVETPVTRRPCQDRRGLSSNGDSYGLSFTLN
jgi:hypothetical protein